MQKVGYILGYKKPINLDWFKKLNFIFGRVQAMHKSLDALNISRANAYCESNFFLILGGMTFAPHPHAHRRDRFPCPFWVYLLVRLINYSLLSCVPFWL